MKYFIYVKGEKIPISEKMYKSYWQVVNHEKYIRRKDRKNGLLLFSTLSRENIKFEDTIKDNQVDVEKIVETKLMIEELYKAMMTLSNMEYNIIKSIYFDEYTIRQVADQQEMSPTSIFRIRNKILANLKNILDK